MLAIAKTAVLAGIDAILVDVEVDSSSAGFPYYTVVGLPDATVRESRERIVTAIRNAGLKLLTSRVTVNLAPADLRKEGGSFDLPIAMGILAASGIVDLPDLGAFVILGELALDGAVRPVRGALAATVLARQLGFRGILLPEVNAAEGSLVRDYPVVAIRHLTDAVEILAGRRDLHATAPPPAVIDSSPAHDFREVKGQQTAKRALEIAAAGAHNVLMIGPPGSGKTMLARCLPSILPAMTVEEIIDCTKIYSAAGLTDGSGAVSVRPFRAPHHTISDAGLIGGGSHPRPGEISLSHNGVLFMDEFVEYPRTVLEALRQPLEDGTVTISRAQLAVTFPCRLMLVAAMNPCPCGYFGDATRTCSCTPLQRKKYFSKISGPILDRIDIHLEVPTVPLPQLRGDPSGEPSSAIAERVAAAATRQFERQPGGRRSARMDNRMIRKHCAIDTRTSDLLEAASKQMGISARAYHRILRVARTIADLEGTAALAYEHVAEAIQLRSIDRYL